MIRRILTAALVLCCVAGVSRATAQRSHFGVHGGYNTDIEEGTVGVQIHFPLSSAIEFYPSFDYYLVNSGTLLGWNADLKFRAAGAPLYFGGGLGILTGGGNTDMGANLFGGFETRYGATHPFIEVRGLFHDSSSIQFLLGINFTLY